MNTTTTYAHATQSIVSRNTFIRILCNSLLEQIPLIAEWERRFFYRRELGRLLDTGPYLVRDMGLGIDEALHEISKPFYVE
ncbi:hypothetical protein N8198_04850 [Gammaproteobacteria bacterium]|jgi:uncharacterized protein YjiS (DUF1127 family)|nr:hypothetical protein [Gammaproteobacteria bacterium]